MPPRKTKRRAKRAATPRRRNPTTWEDDYVMHLDIPEEMQQEWLLKGKIGDASFGKRVEPRIRQTVCSPGMWRKVAGPFRTRKAAWRHARKLRNKTNTREIRHKKIRGGPSCYSAFGVSPQPWVKGRKTRDYTVCQLPPEKRRACKKTRKNPALITVRNPAPKRKKAKRRSAPRKTSIFTLLRGMKTISVDGLKELAKKHAEFGRALRRHLRFHGTYPDSIEIVELDVKDAGFEVGWALGDQLAIEYDPHETSGRAGPPFRHNFKRGKQLTISSPDGLGPFVVKKRGSRMRVTERGIID